jgi:hypothetical protein
MLRFDPVAVALHDESGGLDRLNFFISKSSEVAAKLLS